MGDVPETKSHAGNETNVIHGHKLATLFGRSNLTISIFSIASDFEFEYFQ